MKTHIMPYFFNEHTIRVIEIDGEPWWVLVDVCRALEIKNPRDVASRLEDYQKRALTPDQIVKIMTVGNSDGHSVDNFDGPTRSRGGAQFLTVINESGVYGVIPSSRSPAARAFNKWLTTEVLPSIRKYGFYDPKFLGEAKLIALDNEAYDAGRNRTHRERLQEEIDRFERRHNTKFTHAFEGIYSKNAFVAWKHGYADTVKALTQGERWKALLGSGFDLSYILWGLRTMTDDERAVRDAMRLIAPDQAQILVAQASRMAAVAENALLIDDSDDSDD